MDKNFLIWKNPKQAVWMLMLVLMGIGCVNVFSASYVKAAESLGNGAYFLLRYLVYGLLGLVAMGITIKFNYRYLLDKKIVYGVYLLVLVMLGLVDVMGLESGGAQRWLPLGPITIQPSELAKLAVIMMSARTLGLMLKRQQPINLLQGEGKYLTLFTIVYGFLVYKQPDMGTAAIIVALVLGLFIVAGIPWIEVVGVMLLGVVAAVSLVIVAPYRLDRIKVWFDPWLDEIGDGYQMVQSLLSIGSGGLTGTNWGQGSSKFFYLPEAHTDFAFAVFCQENGFVGASILIFLFVLLGMALFKIALSAKNERGFILAAGVSFLIVGQAAANMAMVCGILPVIGVPLVFISYGGTSMVISMIAIGMALSVYEDEVARAYEEEERRPQERRNDLRVVSRRWQP